MTFAPPELKIMFPVPLLTFKVEGADALNRQLLGEIARRRTAETGATKANRYGGWHSEKDLFDRKEPAHAALAAEILAMVDAATAKLHPELPREQLRVEREGWINVNPTHAFNAPHDHSSSYWSGCYYVHVPEAAGADDRLSGVIEFIDSRGHLGESGALHSPFARGMHRVRPVAGTALIWPGFVKHFVHPNASSEERVTIAFNAWFRKKRRVAA